MRVIGGLLSNSCLTFYLQNSFTILFQLASDLNWPTGVTRKMLMFVIVSLLFFLFLCLFIKMEKYVILVVM